MVNKTNVAAACVVVLLLLHIVDYNDFFAAPDATAALLTAPPRVVAATEERGTPLVEGGAPAASPVLAQEPREEADQAIAMAHHPGSQPDVVVDAPPYVAASRWTDQSSENSPHNPLFTREVAVLQRGSYYPPSPDRYCARWLPTGYTLFCTSFDNDTTMDLESPEPLDPDDSYVEWVPVPACPHNPVKLLVFPQETPIGHATKKKRLNRKAIKAALTQRKPPVSKELQSARAKLYVTAVLLWRQIVTERPPFVDGAGDGETTVGRREGVAARESHRRRAANRSEDRTADGATSESADGTDTDVLSGFQSAVLPECLHHCLAYPCCVSFQAEALNLTHAMCNLYAARQDESAYVSPKQVIPLYVLAQRREFRPSLVDDALRLVITRGPAPIETLDPLCNGCLRKPLEVRLHGKFGVLQHRGYFGTVTLRVVVPDRNETTVGRVVKLSMRDGVATGDASQFFALVSAAGRKVCVEAALDGHLQDAGGSSLMGIEPRAARVCTVVGLPPARTVLRFGGPESGFDNESYVTRDPDTCAPYLRPTECCIRGFWYRIEDAEGRRTVPGYTHDLYTAHYATMGQPTAPRVTLTSLIQHPCVRLVDGYHSIAIPTGEGSFPVLVVDVVCDARLRDNMWPHGLPMQLETQFGSAPTAYGHLPWHVVSECMRRSALDTNTSQSYASSRRANATNQLHLNGDGTPRRAIVGFSIRAHRELPFLAFQLKTIHAFAAQSVVALHLSSQWKLTATEMEAVALLNASHPRTFVNPIRVRASSWKATHVHAANFAFLLASPLGVSHVVIWAANELLVRVGIVEYVQRYDMSAVDGMDPHDGLAYAHSLHHIAWWTPEQHRLGHHALWWWMPWDGVSGELLYSGIVRDRAAKFEASGDAAASEAFRRFPTHQLMLEGMFFNREMAQEFVYVAQETPLGEYCTTSGQYSDNEIFPFLTMRKRCGVTPGLRCGGRVSTMLWRDFLYLATQPALEETRCSAFANPFGWKRVRRTMEDPAVLALEQAMLDPERVHRPRDDVHHCPRTWSAISREKERLMPLML